MISNHKLLAICIVFNIIILNGCAVHGNKEDEIASKFISPPSGHALIYVIRAPGYKSGIRSIPFYLNQQEIGKLWSDQYLYLISKPMKLTLTAPDGRVKAISIKADTKYYLLYGYEMSMLDSFTSPGDFWNEILHFKILSDKEGKFLISTYNLSGNFRRVIVSSSGEINLGDTSRSSHSNINNTYETIYESKTNKGTVTVSGNINLRHDAIKAIMDICKVKNVALSTVNKQINSPASFLTLTENLSKSRFTMDFECIY